MGFFSFAKIDFIFGFGRYRTLSLSTIFSQFLIAYLQTLVSVVGLYEHVP